MLTIAEIVSVDTTFSDFNREERRIEKFRYFILQKCSQIIYGHWLWRFSIKSFVKMSSLWLVVSISPANTLSDTPSEMSVHRDKHVWVSTAWYIELYVWKFDSFGCF